MCCSVGCYAFPAPSQHLPQKAYALCLLGSQLADDKKTAPTQQEPEDVHTLLDVLTPMIKTWPSDYGPKANYMAIQVLGGHGYINEHPVEMFYRDNRLNPIHEGTTGIQSLDLLGRKVPMNKFAGYTAALTEIQKTISAAEEAGMISYAAELGRAIETLKVTTSTVLGATQEQSIDLVFSNSVSYLDMFGHIVIAWLWLKQGLVAERALQQQPHADDVKVYRGKLPAMQYFYRTELPQIHHYSELVKNIDSTSFEMQSEWF